MDDVDAGAFLEDFPQQMRLRAVPRRREVERARMSFRVLYELLKRLCRHRRMNRQKLRAVEQKSDRHERRGIVAEVLVYRRRRYERTGRTCKQGVPVRLGCCDGRGAERSACAARGDSR